MLAAITIQPHITKKITPQKLMPFSWDKRQTTPEANPENLTHEELAERRKKVLSELGKKY
jgi:tRNA A37 methylthiotransferase MiaB